MVLRTSSALLVAAVVAAVPAAGAVAQDRAPDPPTRGPAAEEQRRAEATTAPPPATTERADAIIVELVSEDAAPAVRDRAARLAGEPALLGAALEGRTRVVEFTRPLPLAALERIGERLVAEGSARSVQPDHRLSIAATPDDPLYPQQWHLTDRFEGAPAYGVDAAGAWSHTLGSDEVVVAVVDTGVLDHPDIVDRLVPGYDFVDGDDDARDPGDRCDELGPNQASSWHGTHVAGTIGAATDNATGVAGVDRRARVQPVRVLGPCGGDASDTIAGIRWAAGLPVPGVPINATPADVINLSLGGKADCYPAMQAAIADATTAGSTVVVAAGNAAVDAGGTTPANCDGVITVAATTHVGDRAGYSNFGRVVDIAAPGGDAYFGRTAQVLSLTNTGVDGPNPDGMTYGWSSGTSMAAPHVSGTVSLVLAEDATLTPADVRRVLRDAARPFPTTSPSGPAFVCSSDPDATYHCGAGVLSAAAAVAAVSGSEPAPPAAPPTATALSATAGEQQVALSWTASTHAAGIATYELHRTTASTCTRSAPVVHRGAGRTYTDTTVSGGTTYRYCAVAIAGDGQVSPLSNTVAATPTAPPPPPSWPADARLLFDLESDAIRLTWPAASGTAVEYEVRRDGVTIATTTSRSALVTGLRVDQRYRLDVRAVDRGGASPRLTRHLTPSAGFGDVPSSSGFATDIRWLATGEVTRGCGGDRFCPGDDVTRQQMAAFLTRALGLTETSSLRFSDVPRGSTFETDINKLATAGITLGCGGTRFCPTARVTRQQMAAFLARGLELTATSGARFSDVPRGSDVETDIDKLATAGITLGCGGTRFCPGDPVTRQQMAAFLRRGLTP